jgi:hypothetical protein
MTETTPPPERLNAPQQLLLSTPSNKGTASASASGAFSTGPKIWSVVAAINPPLSQMIDISCNDFSVPQAAEWIAHDIQRAQQNCEFDPLVDYFLRRCVKKSISGNSEQVSAALEACRQKIGSMFTGPDSNTEIEKVKEHLKD